MDIVLLVIGLLVVTYCAIEGFGRSILLLFIFYITTIVLGMVMLSVHFVQNLGNRVAEMIGGNTNQSLFETLLFLALLIPCTIGIFLLTHYTIGSLNFSRIQWLDTLLSTMTGVILALCIIAIISNTWGIIVSSVWQPEQTWRTFQNAYATSILRPHMQRVLAIYHELLFPFKMSRYPRVYTVNF
ncbi:MAG: hypothetical protein E4H27_03510 [Anaerolineales bacterium]|nr:MAG: hypothetical protein E4H27_03510 [Anaerolineales bacterium]